jgi:hypothetical protein
MKKYLFALLLCACILCSGCITGSDEDNAKDVVRDYYSAYNDRDAESIVSLYASEVIDGAGGEETFGDNLSAVLDLADQTNLTLKIVRFLNVRILDDKAFVYFDVNLVDDTRDETTNVRFELIKEDGKWRISSIG